MAGVRHRDANHVRVRVRVLDLRQPHATRGGIPDVVPKQVWKEVPRVEESDATVRMVNIIIAEIAQQPGSRNK